MKNIARDEKTQDKDLAKEDPLTNDITLDLQAVLPTPCNMVSQLYYIILLVGALSPVNHRGLHQGYSTT